MNQKGFTLIELLIVIGVLAVLATVTVFLLNPAQMMAQGRDTRRISDLKNIDTAISLNRQSLYEPFIDDTIANRVYVSLPDTNNNDLCDEYSLPLLTSPWEYRCLAPAGDLRNINKTGWIPIDFASISTNPLTILPIDPVNNIDPVSNVGYYYTYSWDASSNPKPTVAAKLESKKYLDSYANNAQGDGGNDNDAFETRPIAWTISSGIEIAGCATLDQPGKTYLLTADITNSSTQQCINIAADNVTFDCQGHTIDGDDIATYGIYLYRDVTATTSVTIQNCVLSDWKTSGIYFYRAGGNSLSNITLSSNPQIGLKLLYSDSNTFAGISVNLSQNSGISVNDSTLNTFNDITLNSNRNGIRFNNSDSNILTNVTANQNTYGFYLDRCEGNTISDSAFTNNSVYDFFVYAGSDAHCNNSLTNVNGTGDKPILYVNSSSTIENVDNLYSEIILCNADGSYLNNITLDHTGLTKNNALFLVKTDNAVLENINIINLRDGLYFHTSYSNTVTNITSTSNLSYSSHGIYFIYSDFNTVANANLSFNQTGVSFGPGSSNIINNSRIENNSCGVEVRSTQPNIIYNNIFDNNTNVYLPVAEEPNNWSTSTTSTGPNIIGGPYIGGNHWTNPSGTGYSDTCTSTITTGICDAPYDLLGDGTNVDSYPLAP